MRTHPITGDHLAALLTLAYLSRLQPATPLVEVARTVSGAPRPAQGDRG
jgi:hypothetical protein